MAGLGVDCCGVKVVRGGEEGTGDTKADANKLLEDGACGKTLEELVDDVGGVVDVRCTIKAGSCEATCATVLAAGALVLNVVGTKLGVSEVVISVIPPEFPTMGLMVADAGIELG